MIIGHSFHTYSVNQCTQAPDWAKPAKKPSTTDGTHSKQNAQQQPSTTSSLDALGGGRLP